MSRIPTRASTAGQEVHEYRGNALDSAGYSIDRQKTLTSRATSRPAPVNTPRTVSRTITTTNKHAPCSTATTKAPQQSFKTPSKPARQLSSSVTDTHGTLAPPASVLGGRVTTHVSQPRTPRALSHNESRTPNPLSQRPVTGKKASEPPKTPSLRKAKSSAGLREHIAKARAELQKSARKTSAAPVVSASENDPSFEASDVLDDPFSAIKDPFNQSKYRPKANPEVDRAIKKGRESGKLNIANLQLQDIPTAVHKMYQADPSHVIDFSSDYDAKWYEYEELTHFNAADNEIDCIAEEFSGIFGALQTLDLHNNRLVALPQSVVQFSQLTIINLSGNSLKEDTLNLLCHIDTLSELHFGRNQLSGILPPAISKLQNLNILDISENELEAIDYSLASCSKIHTLNLSGNRITILKASQVASMSGLVSLDASRNRISNIFVDRAVSLPRLELLNLSHNLIPGISRDIKVDVPSLATLILLQTRISDASSLEPILQSSVHSLTTLNLEGTQLTVLPDALYALKCLKHLDISDCRLQDIDYRLGHLASLEALRWEGNPARLRGCFGLSTAEMLKYLRARGPVSQLTTQLHDADIF